MSRAKFVITSSDYLHASEYLYNRLRLHKLEFLDSISLVAADKEFTSVIGGGHKPTVRAALLQEWCEKFLSDKDWVNLKTNIRKRRQRWKDHSSRKSLTVSTEVHELLSRLATRDSVTFDEVLLHALRDTVKSGRKIKVGRG